MEIKHTIVVDTDGRTVWLNSNAGCVARFCPLCGEVLNNIQTEPIWAIWKEAVLKELDFIISDNYQPVWSK